jgi:hypothetical protein
VLVRYERDREGLVGEALGLIACARRGLTEAEILRLLRPATLPQLPLATWTPLRAALEEGLVDRAGVLNFAHDFLRAAVEAAFVPDEERRRTLRLRLADDFEAQPVDARNCDELPWVLREAQSCDRLRACLVDIDRFLEIQARDQEELMRYWVWLDEERAMGPYVESFEQWSDAAAKRSGGSPSPRIGSSWTLRPFTTRRSLSCCARWRSTSGAMGRNTHRSPSASTTWPGCSRPRTARLAEAEPLMRRHVVIFLKFTRVTGHPHPHLQTALGNYSRLLQAMGRTPEQALAELNDLCRPYGIRPGSG